ncbi:MAG TPA: phosphatase PAP2 family protein [Blastocatellia bacterium]|nr:phosphatase PAP2 family protein [Blastocatellia bacterium]
MSDATERLTDEENMHANDRGETDLTVSHERAARRARWAEIVFIIALSFYAVLAVLAHHYAYFQWDVSINRAIRSIALPGFSSLMIGLSWLGSDLAPVVLVVGTGVALMAAGFRLEGLICMIGVSLGSAMNSLLKILIARPRPDPALIEVLKQYDHNSFPSGHVTFFVEYFGFLLFLSYVLLKRGRLRKASFVLFGLLIFLISISRVYMGAHWPSDTLGAYLAGGVWLMLMIEAYSRLKAKRG